MTFINFQNGLVKKPIKNYFLLVPFLASIVLSLEIWIIYSEFHTQGSSSFNDRSVSLGKAMDDSNQIDICFVSCIYAKSEAEADKPGDFSSFQLPKTTAHFSLLTNLVAFWLPKSTTRFFLFTNLLNLEAPGWTKIYKAFNYRRYITQSRWGKFLGWKHEKLQGCKTIFYFDGHFAPQQNMRKYFIDMAKAIHDVSNTDVGLAQVKHKASRTALEELDAILIKRKDIKENVDASISWLKAQPDFFNNCTLYENSFFGYNPKDANFQKAAEFFWNHYSQEIDSWRDQPLWCYTLSHFHLTPLVLKPRTLFAQEKKRTGHNRHRYDATADNDASVQASRSST